MKFMTRTTKKLFFAIGFLLLPLQAASQEQLLTSYVADIGPQDHYTSSGARHTTFAGLLAQDRANYHRFNIRHKWDQPDDIFAERAMRAQISPAVLDVPSYYQQYVRNILNSSGEGGTYMVIYVHGIADRITRITFDVPG